MSEFILCAYNRTMRAAAHLIAGPLAGSRTLVRRGLQVSAAGAAAATAAVTAGACPSPGSAASCDAGLAEASGNWASRGSGEPQFLAVYGEWWNEYDEMAFSSKSVSEPEETKLQAECAFSDRATVDGSEKPEREPEPEPEPEPERQLQVGEYTFSDRASVGGSRKTESLWVKGTSRLTYWSFPICCAVLYLPQKEIATAQRVVSSAVPKVLQLKYLRNITAEDFRTSTRSYIKANGLLSPVVEHTLEQFNSFYRDVDVGDQYTLSFSPAGGVQLQLNGTLMGTAHGAEFAEALFSVWFGDQCFMEKLKSDLTVS